MKMPKQDSDVSAKVDCFGIGEGLRPLPTTFLYYTIFPTISQEKKSRKRGTL